MLNTPSRNPYISAASRILFGDEELAHQDWFARAMMDYAAFTHPYDGRLMSVNALAAELETAANG